MARLQYQPATNPRGFQPIQLSRAGIARMEEEGNRVIRNLQQQQAATNDQRRENLQAMRANSAYEDQARERDQRTLEANIKNDQIARENERKFKIAEADRKSKNIKAATTGLIELSSTLANQAAERTKTMIEDQIAEGAQFSRQEYLKSPELKANFAAAESQIDVVSEEYDQKVLLDGAKGFDSSLQTAKNFVSNPGRGYYWKKGYYNEFIKQQTPLLVNRALQDTEESFVDENGKSFSGFQAANNANYMRIVLGKVQNSLYGSTGLNINSLEPGFLADSSEYVAKFSETKINQATTNETNKTWSVVEQQGEDLRTQGKPAAAARLDMKNPKLGREGALKNYFGLFSAQNADGSFRYSVDELNANVITPDGQTVFQKWSNSQRYQNAIAARRKARTDFIRDDQARVRTEAKEFDRQAYAGFKTLLNAPGTGPGRDLETIATYIAGRNDLFPGEPLSQRIVDLQKSNLLENQTIEKANLEQKIRLRTLDPAAVEGYTNPIIQGQAAIAYKELKKERLGPNYARTEKIIKEKGIFVTKFNKNVVGKESYQTFLFEKKALKKYEDAYLESIKGGANPEVAEIAANAYVDKLVNTGINDPNSDFYRTTGPLNSFIFPKLEAEYANLSELAKESQQELLKGILKKGVKIVDEPGALGTVEELEESNNDFYSNNGKFRYNSKELLVAKVLDITLYAVRNARTQAFNKADGGDRRLIEPTPLEKEVFDQDPQTLKLITDTEWITNNRFRRTVHSTPSMGNGPVRASMTGTGVAPVEHTNALVEVAGELGVSPIDLATIIGFETAGTYDPGKVGGQGKKYRGLIQFGESERAAYGVVPGMSFEEQLRGPVKAYLKDRFAKAGMSTQGANLEDLYTTVIAGNPGANRDARDSFGTSARSGVAKMGPHRERAMQRFGLSQN